MPSRASRLAAAATAAGLLLLAFSAVRFGPTLSLSLALAAPWTEAWLPALAGEPAREEVLVDGASRPILADLYRPARPRGGLVLVHGLSPAGHRHPEMVRLARLLARHGQMVLVPRFPGLAAYTLGGHEVEEIRSAIRHAAGLVRPVGVVGFSFGAGPTLLAAAGEPALSLVASFGGYADLRHVVAFVTTGVHGIGDRRYVQRQEEYNRWKLLALLVGFTEDRRDRRLLEAVARRKLADPADDTRALEGDLGREGRAVLALVRNRSPEAVPSLLAALPPRARRGLDDLSPLRVVPRLPGRLLIAHGEGDPSIPFTESLLLAQAAGGQARVAILETFHHTGPRPLWRSARARLVDAARLVGLVDALLAAR